MLLLALSCFSQCAFLREGPSHSSVFKYDSGQGRTVFFLLSLWLNMLNY